MKAISFAGQTTSSNDGSKAPLSASSDQITIPGKGAFGTVHKAIKVGDGGLVAIKIIQIAELPKGYDEEKTMKECELLQGLSHPNIVKVLDHVQTQDTLCFVFDFVEGGSLYNIIKKFGTFPESLVAIYVEQLLQGLAYLHENGIIHSDIKAANLLIDKAGTVKLADFGIARKVNNDEATEPMDPSTLGSPFWMPPEVILMTGRSFSSDIWSLGCTVLELLTGDPPYIDLPAMTAMFRIVEEGKPPFPNSISEDARDFLEKCFVDEEGKRSTARQLLEHKWLHQTPKEEKKKLAKSLSQKNLSQTVAKLKPIPVAQVVSSFEPDLSDLLNVVPPSSARRKTASATELDPITWAEALKKLHHKRGSLRKRIVNLEKHQGAVSRMEKLYKWRGNQDQSPRVRLQRYKNYLQTVEEHLDKVKGSVYQRAKVVKEYRPQSKTGLKLKKGQTVFVHSAEGEMWKGEKQYSNIEGFFPADCVKLTKTDKASTHHRLFSKTERKSSGDNNSALIDAQQALIGLEEDERRREEKKGRKSSNNGPEDMKAELRELREKVQQLEERAKKDAERIRELTEENKKLQEMASMRNSGGKHSASVTSPLKKSPKSRSSDDKEKDRDKEKEKEKDGSSSPTGSLKPKKKAGSARETSPNPLKQKNKESKDHNRRKSETSFLYG